MRRSLLVPALVLAVLMAASAQRTTRRGRTAAVQRTEQAHAAPRPGAADTVVAPDSAAVVLAGYDKALNATRESLFVTNAGTADTLSWMLVTIDYTDMAGRQLHRRTVAIACDIPPQQTRRLDIPSWDSQCVYYYHATQPHRRTLTAASPYRIALRIDSIAMPRPGNRVNLGAR